MMILTETNLSADLSQPQACPDDLFYTALDWGETDWVCDPVIFLDRYVETVAITIMGRTVQLPASWSLLIGDRDTGKLDLVSVEEAARGAHEVLLLNPATSRVPSFSRVRLAGNLEGEWLAPRLRRRHLLAMPLAAGDAPLCIVAGETNRDTREIDRGSVRARGVISRCR